MKAAVLTTILPMQMQKGSEIHRASLGELANSRPGSQDQKFNYLWLKCGKISLDTGLN